jgi:hypothetical protein
VLVAVVSLGYRDELDTRPPLQHPQTAWWSPCAAQKGSWMTGDLVYWKETEAFHGSEHMAQSLEPTYPDFSKLRAWFFSSTQLPPQLQQTVAWIRWDGPA